jgi:hypothetical protein
VRYFYFLQRGSNEQGVSRALKKFKALNFALRAKVLGVGSVSQVKHLEMRWLGCQCLGTDNLN